MKNCIINIKFLILFLLVFCPQYSSLSKSIKPVGSLSGSKYIADYRVAKESVLRSIPVKYIDKARNNLKIAYQHTSHGTHVSFGMYGLADYKTGDSILFGISTRSTPVVDKLYFRDYAFGKDSFRDLSQADANWSEWVDLIRTYLDNPSNADINILMWSWCNIAGHSADNYISSMEVLISEYGVKGTKIGTGSGKRVTPVTFIFMTGHANRKKNVGDGRPKNLAETIVNYCERKKYYCLDYYSIDTHDMDDNYWEDTGDDGNSSSYDNSNGDSGTDNFYLDWQNAHTLGKDWFNNKSSVGGKVVFGAHNSQHITANRKAYAMWWILARIAGWNGNSK